MIDSRAIIDPKAIIAEDVEVGPWSYIGPDVEIGPGSVIHSHVVIKGPTRIGKNNQIFQFASVGEDCQDKKYNGEPTHLEIGDNNVIREGCTIHRGTVQDKSVTQIGNNNLFMAYVHVGHDSVIENDCIFANNSAVAGHVKVGSGAILGGYSTVHQFCYIGQYSMSAAHTAIFKDVPAFVMVSGNPAAAHGMNFEGMRRRQYSPELIKILRQAYKVVYRQGLTLEAALEKLSILEKGFPEVSLFVDSLKASTRGITR